MTNDIKMEKTKLALQSCNNPETTQTDIAKSIEFEYLTNIYP